MFLLQYPALICSEGFFDIFGGLHIIHYNILHCHPNPQNKIYNSKKIMGFFCYVPINTYVQCSINPIFPVTFYYVLFQIHQVFTSVLKVEAKDADISPENNMVSYSFLVRKPLAGLENQYLYKQC